jgi:hypothetical protein
MSQAQRDYRSIWNTQAVSELFSYRAVVGGRRGVAKMGGIKAYCSHNGANRRLLGTAQMEHGSTSVQEESTRWTIFAVFEIKKEISVCSSRLLKNYS